MSLWEEIFPLPPNTFFCLGFPVTHQPAMQETKVRSLGREDPLKKEMATHSSILAWKIPWTVESEGMLQSMMSQKGQIELSD